ncbi:15189_t:CDS:1, partial [Dentiscutata heterogama]
MSNTFVSSLNRKVKKAKTLNTEIIKLSNNKVDNKENLDYIKTFKIEIKKENSNLKQKDLNTVLKAKDIKSNFETIEIA